MARQIRRRRVLARTTAFGAVAVAGCLGGGDGDGGDGGDGDGDDDGGDGDGSTATPTDTDTATATPTEGSPTPTATGTGTADDDATPTDDDTAGPTGTATGTSTATVTATATPTATSTAASGSLEVVIEGFAFDPVRAAVTPGTTVTWVNRDRAPHTVTSTRYHDVAASWEFDERLAGGGDATVEYTFEEPGIYQYVCNLHGSQTMCGAVLVGDVSLDQSMPCE